MTTHNCTQCIRAMKGPPFFRNAKGWLVCFDCLTKESAPLPRTKEGREAIWAMYEMVKELRDETKNS